MAGHSGLTTQRKFGVGGHLLLVTGGALTLALALACRADLASPLIMLLSVAAPLWALLALVAGAALLLSRAGTVLRILGGAGVLVAVALLVAELGGSPANRPALPPGPDQLRIVEFNLYTRNMQPAAAATWIAAQKPDVAILLEASGSGPVVEALTSILPYRTSCRGDRSCTTVILSRLPPVERLGLSHGDADNRRTLSAALIRFDAPWDATIVAVHLSRPLPLGRQAREMNQLIAALAGRRDRRLVVSGDFNAPDWSIAFRSMTKKLAMQPVPSLASWPTDGRLPPFLTIDHSLLRGDWGEAHLHRGPMLGSDHRPFLLVLTPARHGPAG